MDRGVWQAVVHGVTESRTRLSTHKQAHVLIRTTVILNQTRGTFGSLGASCIEGRLCSQGRLTQEKALRRKVRQLSMVSSSKAAYNNSLE